ncbi:MAG: LLM class flavin-dependent oxidoreductase [Gammaproteobacteria bacterium]|nr:LLM class flavin-dependent oxidoreductase [Gammaproteobacteria bacterium]
MTLKFSIDVSGFLPLDDYVRLGKLAESLGFDEFHVVDDLNFKPAWPLLALIGANTSRIRLGPWLIAPRIVHPAYHAENLALLDLLTGGRAVCAVGRGAFFEYLGLPPPDKPLTMLREALHIIRRMLAGDRTPFDGQVFKATAELALRFEPQRRSIPLLIGTFGPQTCELAGQIADGFVTSCVTDPGYVRMLRASFDAGARAVGRDPGSLEVAVSPLCSVARDREAAYALMRQLLPQALPFLQPMSRHAGLSDDTVRAAAAAAEAGDHARAASFIRDSDIRFFTAVGTPRDVIPQVEALIDAGANHIAFGGLLGPDPGEAIRLIGTEIVPRFR